MRRGAWIEATRKGDGSRAWLRRVRWYDATAKAERERFEVIDEDEYGFPRVLALDLQPAQEGFTSRRETDGSLSYAHRLLARILDNIVEAHEQQTRAGT